MNDVRSANLKTKKVFSKTQVKRAGKTIISSSATEQEKEDAKEIIGAY